MIGRSGFGGGAASVPPVNARSAWDLEYYRFSAAVRSPMTRRFTWPPAGRRRIACFALGSIATLWFGACAGVSSSSERDRGENGARGGAGPAAGRSGSVGGAGRTTGGVAPSGGVPPTGGRGSTGGAGAAAGQSGMGGTARSAGASGDSGDGGAAGGAGEGGAGGDGAPTCPGSEPRCGAICCPDNRWHCDDFAGAATCDVEPGCVGAPPICFEGSACCPDGTWECRDGPLCVGRM